MMIIVSKTPVLVGVRHNLLFSTSTFLFPLLCQYQIILLFDDTTSY